MDSYPPEFVQHPQPLLHVAGLLPPPPPTTPDGQPAPPEQPSTDPFVTLQAALRKTFASKKTFAVRDTSRGAANDFHTVLVDKNVRFPPLKARPTSTTQQPPPALHSPISPLTPTSPLYPDGIIAPIWIRKHRELVPSVFILVLRLFEHEQGQTTHAPLDPAAREDAERAKDAELVREIVERKRATLERGIKLAVVLLCSRALLDDPALDFRLSVIRRQSGLDSRASLFVISPVPQSEVANFVQSVRAELYPAAIDYYREHGRRVRRRRARPPPPGGLSERGWNVRYDYKLALFAEMRSEIEVALKHYEDCYDNLIDTFSQPNLLAPRTKRWAEAKVLADCVSIKISKLYLYLNEPSRALAQLNEHVFRFRELSATWQIGEDTFEFWSWLSKQYRLFGDLTAVALRNGFRLPSLKPPPTPRPPPPGSSPSLAAPSPGLVPLNVLQHAGHYYHLAGVCAVQRRERFRVMREAMEREAEGEGKATPALVHEQKVDHAELIVELFTKAYEFFKAHKAKNMTYFIASEIAAAHLESGKHDLALRFHDRIAKNYRRDRWREILDAVLARSFRSAVAGGEWESAIRVGMELLAPTSRISVDERARFAEEVLDILRTKTPSSPEKASISLDMTDSAPLFDCRLAFWSPSTPVSAPVPFQLSLSSTPSSRSSALLFSQLAIHFNDDRPPVVVRNSGSETDEPAAGVERVALGDVTKEGKVRAAALRWADPATKVFTGSIALDRELGLTVDKVVLAASIGAWQLSLTLKPQTATREDERVWFIKDKTVPLQHAEPSICPVVRRDLRTKVSTTFDGPAYLGERFPVSVEVTNEDEVDVQVFLVLFLQPGDDGASNQVHVDSQSSTSVIESLSLGSLAPSASLSKTFHLTSLGVPGVRFVDVTVRAIPTLSSSPAAALPPAAIPSPAEVTRTLSIPAVPPLLATFDAQVLHARRAGKALLDLSPPDGWEAASDATAVVRVQAAGPWDVEVLSLRVRCEDERVVRVTESSLDGLADGDFPQTWKPLDLFNAIFHMDVKPLPFEQPLPTGAFLDVTWQRAGTTSPTVTAIPFPPIQPAPLLPSITLRLPPYFTLHEPTTLLYRFSNPTGRLLTLSSQIDSPAVPSSFVFSGPRRLPEWLLAPNEERTIAVRVVPLLVGEWTLPRFRVWEVEHPPPGSTAATGETTTVDEEGRAIAVAVPQAGQPRLHELEVRVETDAVEGVGEVKDPAQAVLEADLRSARGEDAATGIVVTVLPR
ncbi:hypothetical protein JCM10207_002245 [Rhodosporidiobolus poonsookiae]